MSNEITVKLKCSIEEMYKILDDKGFEIVDKFSLDDIYFASKDIDINKMLPREILKHCILIREITQYMPELRIIKMTYKNKNIAPNGDIINQENVNCSIINVDEGITVEGIENIKSNIISYGFNTKSTVTASSVDDDSMLICLQRAITSRIGNKLWAL